MELKKSINKSRKYYCSQVSACCSPSCPELRRCSPRSQPNTLSRRMPLCFSFCLVGLDFMKERKKVISFPCFLDTEKEGRERRMHLRSLIHMGKSYSTVSVGLTQDQLSHNIYLCTRVKPHTSCSGLVPLCILASF